MASTEQHRDRHAIPRLRSFAAAVSLGELSSPQPPANTPAAAELSKELIADWENERTVSVAADLVSSALAAENTEPARQAARFLLDNPETPPAARQIAGVCLGESDPQEIAPGIIAVHAEGFTTVDKFAAQIRRTRQQLAQYPADAVLWMNLASLYLSLGQHRQALRALRAAMSLAPQNRFIVRSAARILLHLEQRDEAHAIVARAGGVKDDPWLLAAEVSIAADNGGESPHIKHAERVLEKERFSPRDSSELAAELATMRALAGNIWAAKKMLRRAMNRPTENTLAQVAWLARIPGVPKYDIKNSFSFEASAHLNRQTGDLRRSMLQTRHWLDDQPFSRPPAQMGSYLATRLDRDGAGIPFAEQGLRSNPDDPILLNNLAFLTARMGQLEKAKTSLRRINLSEMEPEDRYVITATQGLLAFREGDVSRGRVLYTQAINGFKEHKDKRAVVAMVYHAIEELRAGTRESTAMQEMALTAAKKHLLQPEDEPLISQLESFAKDPKNVQLPKIVSNLR
jgi:tetratricopeptide (TPR) repeat protein